MTARGFVVALAVYVGVLASFQACHIPPTGTVGGRVVSCATAEVESQGVRLVPSVNACLVALTTGEAIGCLDALSQALKVSVDVVLCVVRREGVEMNTAAQANPGDVRSRRGAGNARAYLDAKGVQFQ